MPFSSLDKSDLPKFFLLFTEENVLVRLIQLFTYERVAECLDVIRQIIVEIRLDDEQRMLIDIIHIVEDVHRLPLEAVIIWRVHEDHAEVVACVPEAVQRRHIVGGDHHTLLGELTVREVLLDAADRLLCIIDEDRTTGTTGDRLDADAAGACEEIEEVDTLDLEL